MTDQEQTMLDCAKLATPQEDYAKDRVVLNATPLRKCVDGNGYIKSAVWYEDGDGCCTVYGHLAWGIDDDDMANHIAASSPANVIAVIESKRELQADRDDAHRILGRYHKFCTDIVNIIKGPPEPLSMHSLHDCVELVQALQAENAALVESKRGLVAFVDSVAKHPTTAEAYFGHINDGLNAQELAKKLDSLINQARKVKKENQ